MKLAVAVTILSFVTSARAEQIKNVPIRVVATATKEMAKHPAWRAIGQEAADRYGWCLDKDGTGEAITFALDTPLPISELQVTAGYGPEWQASDRDDVYGYPDRLAIKTDAQAFESPLRRAEPDKIALSGAPVRTITLTILSVKKGKAAPTCINRIELVSPKVHYRNVYGIDAAAFAELPRFATALDAAFKSCDATVLRTAIKYPLAHEHNTITMQMGEGIPAKKLSYKSADELVKACKQPGSYLQLGLGGAPSFSSDPDPATDIAQPFSETAGEVHVGDWNTHAWWLTSVGGWKLTHMMTSETPDVSDAIATVAGEQIEEWHAPSLEFTSDATLVLVQPKVAIVKAADAADALGIAGAKTHKESDVTVTFARDRRTAVLSFTVKVANHDYRVSEVVVRDQGYWHIASGIWSEAKANDAVNKAAQGHAIGTFVRVAPPGQGIDAPLAAPFYAMQKGAIDATAAARKDLVVFGSGPGERSVGGAKLAAPWLAAWANHVPLDASGIVSKLAPSTTTGWVVTDVMLEKHAGKQSYLIPFRLFLVFDKALDGTWSLLHAHIATVAP